MGIKFSIKTSIKFNGKEYGSADEMPSEERQTYERIMAAMADPKKAAQGMITFKNSTTKIVFNGQEYGSTSDMPPEIRQAYEKLLANVDANRNGIPDMLESGTKTAPLPMGQKPAGIRSPLNLTASERPTSGSPRAVAFFISLLILIIAALVFLLLKKNSL
jgi:Fe-S cluster assembly scaffold protein SufB